MPTEAVYPAGELTDLIDETLNDSDKTITVTINKKWKILWIHIEYTATATVGNRAIRIELRDSADDIIYEIRLDDVLTASETVIIEILPQGVLQGRTSVAGAIANGQNFYAPLPADCILKSGEDIHIYDANAIDATADDMIIQGRVLELPL